MEELRQTMARLRGPGGCPWDQEQTHATLARCLIDEVSELLETIDQLDMPHMREELGDVLLQVYFHAQLAEEAGHFDLDDVAREVNEKLIRRHPHVFGDAKVDDTAGVLKQWDQIKAAERNGAAPPAGVFKHLPPRLPALMFAEAVWKQMRKQDLPGTERVRRAEIDALAAELDDAELGRRLFALAAAARQRGLDAEGALRRASENLMRDVEQRVQAQAGGVA